MLGRPLNGYIVSQSFRIQKMSLDNMNKKIGQKNFIDGQN